MVSYLVYHGYYDYSYSRKIRVIYLIWVVYFTCEYICIGRPIYLHVFRVFHSLYPSSGGCRLRLGWVSFIYYSIYGAALYLCHMLNFTGNSLSMLCLFDHVVAVCTCMNNLVV